VTAVIDVVGEQQVPRRFAPRNDSVVGSASAPWTENVVREVE